MTRGIASGISLHWQSVEKMWIKLDAPSFLLESRKLYYLPCTNWKSGAKMLVTGCTEAQAKNVLLQVIQGVGVMQPKMKHRHILSHAALLTSRQHCRGRKHCLSA